MIGQGRVGGNREKSFIYVLFVASCNCTKKDTVYECGIQLTTNPAFMTFIIDRLTFQDNEIMTKDNRVFFSAVIIDKEDEGISYYTLSQGEVAEYYSQLVDVDNFQEVYGEMTYPAQAEETRTAVEKPIVFDLPLI